MGHSIAHADAEIFEIMAIFVLSAFGNFTILIKQLWSYILVVLSFIVFVIYNSGVALGMLLNKRMALEEDARANVSLLGDKANHQLSLHFVQLFYFSGFAFFFLIPVVDHASSLSGFASFIYRQIKRYKTLF
jgi:hypothetical protein